MNDGEDLERDEELDDAASADGAGTRADGGDVDPKFRDLLEKLYVEHNFDFRQYKEGSLLRRVRRRMAQVRVATCADYITYLDHHAAEHTELLNVILINVTRFFRDPEAWGVVRETVLPRLVEEAAASPVLRIWSAGCSSGEEPFSVAMALSDVLGDRRDHFDVKIYGTDIDEDALTTARAGLYRLEQLKDVPRDVMARNFIPDGHAFRLRRDLRKWCIFGRHDLTQDAPLSHMDLILCRNVLIYFEAELQERILPRFVYATRKDGYLFLGRAESLLSRSRRFVPVDFKWRIFKRALPSDHENRGAGLALQEVGASPFRPVRAPTTDHPELRAHDIIETLSAAMIVIDPAEAIMAWNSAATTLFEIPAASAMGKKFRDLDISYRIDGLRARVEAARNTQASSSMPDVVFTRRSGDLVHATIRISSLYDDHRRPVGVVICSDDITDLGQLRDELDRVAEQSATANEELQSTNEELETTNEELQSTNEELETTNEELQSTNEELETTVEELQSLNAELSTVNSELERRTADLNHVEIFQRSIFETLRAALFVLDPHGTVTHWNTAAARLWGLGTELALGREFFELPIGEATRVAREPLQRLRDTHTAQRVGPLPYALPSGEQRQALLELTPILSPVGEMLGIVGIATDDRATRDGA
jgi:two-component system, chemotaxis family, CheB/CheR fusion protein